MKPMVCWQEKWNGKTEMSDAVVPQIQELVYNLAKL